MSQEKCRHWRTITAALFTGIIVLAAPHAGWAQRVSFAREYTGGADGREGLYLKRKGIG